MEQLKSKFSTWSSIQLNHKTDIKNKELEERENK